MAGYCFPTEVSEMSVDGDNGISHKEFFEKALTAAGEWTRFADPKALGVAVFLSFGANDLLRNAERLYFGFSKNNSALEWLLTVCFVGACLLAVLTVSAVSCALFPRLKPKGPRSLFFFGGVAQFEGPEEYECEVREKTPQQLQSHIARQVWNVAKAADAKHWWTQWAYRFLLLFFACWVVARIALSFVS